MNFWIDVILLMMFLLFYLVSFNSLVNLIIIMESIMVCIFVFIYTSPLVGCLSDSFGIMFLSLMVVETCVSLVLLMKVLGLEGSESIELSFYY